jgi:mono/diheme cytochrome c family protein
MNMIRSLAPIFTRSLRYSWVLVCLALVGCHLDMYDQHKYEPNDPSSFFEDGRANRPPVPNTVAVGQFQTDPAFLTGKNAAGDLINELPVELTMDLIETGQVRYNSYCMPCHGMSGDGQGMIARRGPLQVPTFHQDRLRTVEVGYLFDVITNGVNRMYPYGQRISPEDRWAIVAYMRALQLSQNATTDDVPAEELTRLESGQ